MNAPKKAECVEWFIKTKSETQVQERLETSYNNISSKTIIQAWHKWFKFSENGRKSPVELGERVKQVGGTLIIREAKVDDSGKYLCVVNNSVGGESVETVLTVTAPLSAQVEPKVQTVEFGRPATFTCSYRGNPVKSVTWLKDGAPINHREAVLRIGSVGREDKGMYQCFIRNDQESAQATAELKLGGRFEPPQLTHTFGTETLQPGPSVFLKCVAAGNPTPEITWELDGNRLSNSERMQVGQYVTVNGEVVSHLNISSIHTNDGGLYACVASSTVGSVKHAARLNVYGLPYIRPMDKVAVVAGENMVVHCPVAGHPIDSIVWEMKGRMLPINRRQKTFPNGTLIVEAVQRSADQGRYTCVARNSQGYTARGDLDVQVMDPPVILPFTFPAEVRDGQLIQVSCAVTVGDDPITLHWYKDGVPLMSSPEYLINSMDSKLSLLLLRSVSDEHRGIYTCQAYNPAGSSQSSAELIVKEEPKILPFAFPMEVEAGELIQVSCTVSRGDDPISLQWFKDNLPIRSSPTFIINNIDSKLSMLLLRSVDAEHSGNYTCVASNPVGREEVSSYLNVKVEPKILPFSFPLEVQAGELIQASCIVSKGDEPLNIQWYRDNVPLITSINIMINKVGSKLSNLVLPDVNADHRGIYTCQAFNPVGSSEYSAELNVKGTKNYY
ncbi:hypothetical protein SK128_023683 [Halocaridina rubra]|uniref:Ig-like domain-containing protein n=1 Tax=Halocaridina rubra TaxID=373956 RepID=A0AAN9A0F4_HALRR